MHLVFQYAVPAVWPRAYASLCVKDMAVKGVATPTQEMLREAARDARTKAICVLMAVWVTGGAVWGMVQGDGAVLEKNLVAETPLTHHLCLVAASFFLWDVVVSLTPGGLRVWSKTIHHPPHATRRAGVHRGPREPGIPLSRLGVLADVCHRAVALRPGEAY